MNADPLTIAYIAIGARDMLREARKEQRHGGPYVDLSSFNGELGLIDMCVKHAARLDELAAQNAEQFTGVFVYDVAEVFGAAVAQRLLNGLDLPIDDLAKDLIEEVCK